MKDGTCIAIKSMLFADVVGYSKLPESAYPGFVRVFLAGAAEILSRPLHKPRVRNTWGDGLAAVFDHEREAGLAALALQDWVKSVDWARELGQPSGGVNICLRIGLHAGPVHQGRDPVIGKRTYIGRHINFAARLEPIADEGQIFVSGEFAALAMVAGANELRFDYMGQRTLPKNAGVIPVYRLSAAAAG